jgi:transcriptional regulator with XRE-family HTH domain
MRNAPSPFTPIDSTVYRDIPYGYASRVAGLADNIAALRKSAGLNQTQLGDVLGVGQPAVSKWERGETEPSVSDLPRLARALSVQVNDIIAGIDLAYDQSHVELLTPPHTPAHDDSVKKTYDVTSSVTEDGVQPLHPTVELGTVARGDHIAPSDSSRLPEERVLDLHAIRDIINHARAIAAAVATLPAVADEPPAARGTGPGRSADDRPVRPKRTGTHHRR